jgi:hypothetical protein
MKLSLLAVPLAAGLVAACSPMHGPGGGHHGAMATDQRCAVHRQEMQGKTAAEQRAAAEAHIKAMHGSADAAHVDRHLQMMERMCGPTPAAAAR